MNFADLLADPPDTDLAWRAVTTILPTDGEETAFSAVMGVFSTALFLVAVAWLAYATIMMLLRAAERGETLSQTQNGGVIALRVVIGLGALLPVAGGLSTVHYVLRDLVARPGINVANLAAERAVTFVPRDGHPLSPVSAGGRELVLAVVESEVCARAYAASRANMMAAGDGGARLPPPAGTEVVAPGEAGWFPWSDGTPARTTGYAWDWGPACGSVTLTRAEGFADGAFGDARRQAVAAVVEKVRGLGFADRLADAVKTAGIAEVPVTGTDAEAAYASHGMLKAAVDAELRASGLRYDRALSEVASSLSAGDGDGLRAEVVRDVQERGWIALGSYYRVLAYASLSSSEAVAERPVRKRPDPEEWEAQRGAVRKALALVDSQVQRESAATVLATGEELTADAAEGGAFLASLVATVTNPVNDFLTGYSGWRADPVGDLMNLGTVLMVSGQAAFALALAAQGASDLFGGVGSGVLEFVMTPGWTVIGIAWIGGALLTYVLPLVPFLFLTFAAATWAWEVVKAGIAVVVWALLHVRVDEPDLIGQAQKQGYVSLLIGVMLRPAITVASFVALHMMNVTVLNLFLSSYNIAFKASQVGFNLGATGLVVSVGVMVYAQWTLVLWSYKLLTTMPAKIAEFLGFSATAWGDDDAGSSVVGGVTAGHRHMPRMAKGGASSRKDDDGGKGAKAGATALGASAGGALRAAAAGTGDKSGG
ncbi:DotA/TraY family protein [Aureimonas sp. N4]|uniref:DotA/TraY family protein n=1 Tax=Aureimonas sp. N4 TaxID=1638165 RepID=UPI00078374B8|nr:DotA/TraY family protein [Aureimonas sp. N4]